MGIQTILNRVEKFTFVYDDAHTEEQGGGPALVVQVLPRKNSLPYRSGCYRRGPTYDHLKERCFELAPLWGILVFLAYRMRRVNCPRCGVTVEIVPGLLIQIRPLMTTTPESIMSHYSFE